MATAPMDTFDKAVAHDLDKDRVRFERAAHRRPYALITCEEPSFCGGRTQFCVIPQPGSARPNLHGVNWHEYDAALFDLDGVLTPTAEVHMRAWQQLFADFLTSAASTSPTSKATTSTTSTASHATTASARSSPPRHPAGRGHPERQPSRRDCLRTRQSQE